MAEITITKRINWGLTLLSMVIGEVLTYSGINSINAARGKASILKSKGKGLWTVETINEKQFKITRVK